MTDERLLTSTTNAPWLPTGSDAEVWVGEHCAIPADAILARLLVTRAATYGTEFFCVQAAKGPDLPTTRLWGDPPTPTRDGLAELQREVLGRDVATHCVGFIRNVVPTPDDTYNFPTPWAHVPVFLVAEPRDPIVDGEWFSLDNRPDDLLSRHWWPIVETQLTR